MGKPFTPFLDGELLEISFDKDKHHVVLARALDKFSVDIHILLRHIGVRVSDLKDYGKSLKVDASGKLSDIIGADTGGDNPYSDFWKLMKVWPRSQNQRAKEAAIAFREAVDSGVEGRAILEAATALLGATQYVSRLDIWIKNEGYLTAPVQVPSPSVSVQTQQADEVWF